MRGTLGTIMTSRYSIEEEVRLYFDEGYSKTRILWGLIANADRVINSVYIFKHFDEYCRQLNSTKQEDKLEVYWNASYDEKLIDYIKIILAFETLNKALLIKQGILIHTIDNKFFNKKISRKQQDGLPITIEEFFQNNYTDLDFIKQSAVLNGLTKNLTTISFSHTLNKNYQAIIKLDKDLVSNLKEINLKRNRLHLYSDFKGTISVKQHIDKWRHLKEITTTIIRDELKKIDEELKNCA